MLSPKIYAFGCALFAALGAILYGYDLGVISSVLVAPDFLVVTGLTDAKRDANYLGFITSSMLLGAFVGSIPASLIADRFSRRVSIVFAGIVFIMGGAIQTGAQNKQMMLAGRFFAGWGIGSLGVLAPLYQSEIAHPAQRGRLMATFQFSIGIGAVLAGWIAYGCSKASPDGPLRWRVPLGIQLAPALPLVSLTFFLPESPRWLMIKGREEEALVNLARLHARGNVNDAFVRGEFLEMKLSLQHEEAVASSWKEIVTNRQIIRKVMLGITIQFATQMTGVSAIQYYSPTIYKSVGFGTTTTLLIQSINNIVGVIGEVVTILFLDKVGRRFPLIWGNVSSSVCFAICTALARQFVVGKGNKSEGYAFVAMTYIYNFVFSVCIGPLSWVYPAEIMNTNIRAKATAITSMACWISNFMIGQVSPKAFAQVGWRYYLVFTICSMTNAITMYLFFPETAGRTLEEMDAFFAKSSWIVGFNKEATTIINRTSEIEAAGENVHVDKQKPVHDEEFKA